MCNSNQFQKYTDQAVLLGVKEAKIIPVDTIVTAEWVRLKCQYGCSGYNKRLTCPPFSPTPDETRRILQEFRSVLLIHGDRETDIQGADYQD